MDEKGVFLTAPATPGLLKRDGQGFPRAGCDALMGFSEGNP